MKFFEINDPNLVFNKIGYDFEFIDYDLFETVEGVSFKSLLDAQFYLVTVSGTEKYPIPVTDENNVAIVCEDNCEDNCEFYRNLIGKLAGLPVRYCNWYKINGQFIYQFGCG